MRCYFVTSGVECLHLTVIGPLVRHEERAFNGTAVRVLPIVGKYLLIDMPIDIIDRVVESYQNYLRYLFCI